MAVHNGQKTQFTLYTGKQDGPLVERLRLELNVSTFLKRAAYREYGMPIPGIDPQDDRSAPDQIADAITDRLIEKVVTAIVTDPRMDQLLESIVTRVIQRYALQATVTASREPEPKKEEEVIKEEDDEDRLFLLNMLDNVTVG